jgi:hypothetical protein
MRIAILAKYGLAEASGDSLASDEEIEAEINRIRTSPEDESKCA